MDERRRHLAQTVRILPRAEQLFAAPRQRLDLAAERMASALKVNLQDHRRALTESAAVLRPNRISRQFKLGRERLKTLTDRLGRAQNTRLIDASKRLDAIGRVLDSVSYRSVLERGFVLVRGEDGAIRRRAKAVATGERLSLNFADGTRTAVAEGPASAKPKSRTKSSGGGQESLF
jgi:exodeoxyribonuclease VII large subunit